jgi:hypothetical protein
MSGERLLAVQGRRAARFRLRLPALGRVLQAQESCRTLRRAVAKEPIMRSVWPLRVLGAFDLTLALVERLAHSGRPACLEAVAQALRLRQRGERLERAVFDLPDPLAGDAEAAADLVQRSRLTAM